MFTNTDLTALLDRAPGLRASVFMPTHPRGPDTRQGPIRLKNLLRLAVESLSAAGLDEAEAEEFVMPALALIDDYLFWQHQDEGLALFLDSGGLHQFKVVLALTEQVVVGPEFRIKPLLPLLAADGNFCVLTMTADSVRLYNASRFTFAEVHDSGLPVGEDAGRAGSDYENPLQASPVARPHTGSSNIGNAQVYGDSPAEWHKSRLVDFTHRVTTAFEHRLASHPAPFVVVADAEIGGQFRKFLSTSALRTQLAGVVDENPESMSAQQIHQAAYQLIEPRLDAGRAEAKEQLEMLLGRHDVRATTGIDEVVRAAYQGRVDTMFLSGDEAVPGLYDQDADQILTGSAANSGDLLEAAAVQTLHHGGVIHLAKTGPAVPTAVAAIFRY